MDLCTFMLPEGPLGGTEASIPEGNYWFLEWDRGSSEKPSELLVVAQLCEVGLGSEPGVYGMQNEQM